MRRNSIAFLAFSLLLVAPVVRADTTATYLLNSTNISGAVSPFATVLLDQIGGGLNGAGEVRVTVTLDSGATQFADTGGSGHFAFAFNTDVTLSSSAVTFISNPTIPTNEAGWKYPVHNDPGSPVSQSDGGAYNNGFKCYTPSCGNGTSTPDFTGPLVFDVTATNLTIQDFVANANGNRFSADVLTSNGATGLVFGGTLTAAPEPGSYVALLTFGLVGLAVIRTRRQRLGDEATEN